jgi:hypothetical protein
MLTEVFRAGFLIQAHQVIGIPLCGLPVIHQVLVADLRRMTVGLARDRDTASDPCMYMLRAYQSPNSMADCGPQCAQMPNLASRYHSGIRYASSDCPGGKKVCCLRACEFCHCKSSRCAAHHLNQLAPVESHSNVRPSTVSDGDLAAFARGHQRVGFICRKPSAARAESGG